MNKYLIVYAPSTGFAELQNVGLFEADNAQEAVKKAQKRMGASYDSLWAFDVSECENEWTYFT